VHGDRMCYEAMSTRGRGGAPRAAIAGILLVLLSLPLSSPAAQSEPPGGRLDAPTAGDRDEGSGRWSYQLELAGGYDDNITELSDTDRSQVGDPNFADKFKIETPDDWVISPSARLGWIHQTAARLGTTLRFDARAPRYTRNPIKNYEIFGLRFTQDLHSHRKHGTQLVVRAGYIPDFYLRELTVPQASLDQGQRVRDSARYTSGEYSVSIEQVLFPKHLEVAILYGTEQRDYDAPFDERDGDLTGYEGRLLWNASDRSFGFETGYRGATYDARGDRSETPAHEADISSDRAAVLAGAHVRWGRRGRRGALSLDVWREKRDFTSTDPLDVYHFGRSDTQILGTIDLHQPIADSLYVEARWLHEQNDSHLGSGAPTSVSDDVTDYTRDIISFSIGWRH
jgi:hypothetical protein